MCIKMKKEARVLNPLVSGIIGGAAIPVFSLLLMLCLAAVFSGSADPASHVLLSACIAIGLSGIAGGFLAVKLGGALISGVYAAVTTLILLGAVCAFFPESESLLARVLPPVTAALSPLPGGYLAAGKKQTKADIIKKAARKK